MNPTRNARTAQHLPGQSRETGVGQPAQIWIGAIYGLFAAGFVGPVSIFLAYAAPFAWYGTPLALIFLYLSRHTFGLQKICFGLRAWPFLLFILVYSVLVVPLCILAAMLLFRL